MRMYFIGLLTGLACAYLAYEVGAIMSARQQQLYGKAVAYRLCATEDRIFCTSQWLGLPNNVLELPFEALSHLP